MHTNKRICAHIFTRSQQIDLPFSPKISVKIGHRLLGNQTNHLIQKHLRVTRSTPLSIVIISRLQTRHEKAFLCLSSYLQTIHWNVNKMAVDREMLFYFYFRFVLGVYSLFEFLLCEYLLIRMAMNRIPSGLIADMLEDKQIYLLISRTFYTAH